MNTGEKATELSEISRFASPKPLDDDTWHMWVETENARGSGAVVRKLVEWLRQSHTQSDHLKIIFTGHSGSGKSTELFRVTREISDLYKTVIAGIDDYYSLTTVDYRLLLFFCASKFVEEAAEVDAEIREDEAQALLDWFDERTVDEVKSRGHELSVKGGAQLSIFKALFVKFSGRLYSGGETRETVSRHIESRLDQLIANMRVIVQAIEEKLDGQKLLLILEGLDKIEDRDQGRKLFFEHRRQLLDIPCNVIFTFPIALWYEPQTGPLDYPIRYLLPMIPVSSSPILRQIVFQRIDESANLITPEALDYLIQYSGSVLRDLLYLLRESAVGAKVKGRTTIEIDDVQDSARLLRDDYNNRLSPRSYGENPVELNEIYGVLEPIDEWPKGMVEQNEAFKMLLQNLCILEYNNDNRWFDLHPAIREVMRIRDDEQKA
ncbi:MAG: hypothetical protein ACE5JP_06070 [Candidatus Bipolaricaulia bacterium]